MIRPARPRRGFTLIELMIVVAILGVAAMVAAPSMWRYIEVQRLRSVNSEMVVNVQFARSEAVSRRRPVAVKFESDASNTCYTIGAYTAEGACPDGAMSTCSCLRGPGAACDPGQWTEIKAVIVPRNARVRVEVPGSRKTISFDPTSGNLSYCQLNLSGFVPPTFVVNTIGDSGGQLRTSVSATGRPTTCATGASVVGVAAC